MTDRLTLSHRFEQAVQSQYVGNRLWLVSNYHCNLQCSYCLMESSPQSKKRQLSMEQMIQAVQEAKVLGFTSVGITGGEPFLIPWMVDALEAIGQILPVIVLTNGTLFGGRLRHQVLRLQNLPIQLQISVDSIEPQQHDRYRGDGTFHRAIKDIPWLIEQGLSVRVAISASNIQEQELVNMRRWMLSLGLSESDLVNRQLITRGRAIEYDLGQSIPISSLMGELTITKSGAFYSPFAPTVKSNQLQLDGLLTRTILPLSKPLEALLQVATGSNRDDRPEGFV